MLVTGPQRCSTSLGSWSGGTFCRSCAQRGRAWSQLSARMSWATWSWGDWWRARAMATARAAPEASLEQAAPRGVSRGETVGSAGLQDCMGMVLWEPGGWAAWRPDL